MQEEKAARKNEVYSLVLTLRLAAIHEASKLGTLQSFPLLSSHSLSFEILERVWN